MSSHPTEQDKDDRVVEMAFDYCYQVNSNEDNKYSFNQLSVAFISGYEKRSSQIPALIEAAVLKERERCAAVVIQATRIPDCALKRGTGVRDATVVIGERIADAIRNHTSPKEPEQEPEVVSVWIDGIPPKYIDEWFIARLDDGGKVVLKVLPEGHSYDYKTLDETYYSKFRVKKWMQFPDSNYLSVAEPKNG